MKGQQTILIFILGILILYCLVEQKEKTELEQELSTQTYLKEVTDSLYLWQSERLLNYTLVSLRQGEVIDMFQSSRNYAQKDTLLQDLQFKLN
jgi:cell division protein ZapA (FtsZ GTPase activity inhibitor)